MLTLFKLSEPEFDSEFFVAARGLTSASVSSLMGKLSSRRARQKGTSIEEDIKEGLMIVAVFRCTAAAIPSE